MRELTEVFAFAHGEMAHAHVARLAVLYEDLRIECLALVEPSIPVLDVTDERYRANYFLRRCIATLVEFSETIRLLDECAEFQAVKARFSGELRNYWNEGFLVFHTNEEFLERVRNDIGGHFGLKAAVFALENLSPEAVGKIESRGETKPTMHLPFAGELVATATLRHLQGSTSQEKFSHLMSTVKVGFRHATRCAHCVAYSYLWERFGR
jgi:hypothetical protein